MFGPKRNAPLSTVGKALIVASAMLIGTVPIIDPAAARSRYRRHDRMSGPPAPARPVIPYGYSFYPHEIEGGVSGNLSFNNQIRKFRDPLNANGGGG